VRLSFLMPSHIYMLVQVFRLLLDLLATRSLSDQQKDLEILMLRHQLRILQRRLSRSPRVSHWEKGILAVLAAQFRSLTDSTGKRLDEAILLFKPDTVLRWHRQLVRRKWTFQRVGRPFVADPVRPVLYSTPHSTRVPRWLHSASNFCMDDPAVTKPRLGSSGFGKSPTAYTISDPRPRCQVHCFLQRGIRG
jgi:hypothetical protein